MKEKIWDISSLADLESTTTSILENLSGHNVLALHGDLGAGKTTFVQTLAKQLGVTETVTSPTFVIMKSYETTNDKWKRLVHVDAYRLETAEELAVLGFADEVNSHDTLICVEWAEKVKELLPENTLHLYFELTDTGRSIEAK